MIDFPSSDHSRELIESEKAYIRKDLLDPQNSFMKTISRGIRQECTSLRYEYILEVDKSSEYVDEMVLALNEILVDKKYKITLWQYRISDSFSREYRGIKFDWSKEC